MREEPLRSPSPSPSYLSLSLEEPPLANRTGHGVGIAVVDSGLNPDNPHAGPVSGGLTIAPDGAETADYLDRLGHGTAVTAAIQEKAPDARIQVVRVFQDGLSTSLPALVRALARSTDLGVRLINLSLGTPKEEHEDRLREAVERCVARGVLVVSPREHRGRRWWPGSLSGVAGVLLDWDCPRNELRLMEDVRGRPLFRASGYPRPVPGIPRERNLQGISFAAANVTGILGRMLEGREDLDTVEEVAAAVRERIA